MRTTIRIADERRDTLLSLAQARGDKGVSRIVEEAVAFYLEERAKPVPVQEPPPHPGRWQRIGAELDRQMGGEVGMLAMLRALVRGGLRRFPILRA